MKKHGYNSSTRMQARMHMRIMYSDTQVQKVFVPVTVPVLQLAHAEFQHQPQKQVLDVSETATSAAIISIPSPTTTATTTLELGLVAVTGRPHAQLILVPPNANANANDNTNTNTNTNATVNATVEDMKSTTTLSTKITNATSMPITLRSYRYVLTLPAKTGVICIAVGTSHWSFKVSRADAEAGVLLRHR